MKPLPLSSSCATPILLLGLLLGDAGAGAERTPASVPQATFAQRLAAARAEYFRDLQGERAAADRAQADFTALSAERPRDPVVLAYSGSLELLDAARTWAVWNKHRLANDGLHKLDAAVAGDPGNLEARFIRAATTWHLPFFYRRHEQAASDFTFLAPRAEAAARAGQLPPQLAAAALDYYGQVLIERSDRNGARQAFAAAVRVDRASPAGQDASRRLDGAE